METAVQLLKKFPFFYTVSDVLLEKVGATGIQKSYTTELLNREPQIALDIISDLGRKLRDMLDTVRNIATEHVDKRIVFTLLKMYEASGNPVLKIKRQDIAEMCGTTVETAIRITRELEKEGFISTERGEITLLNTAALAQKLR